MTTPDISSAFRAVRTGDKSIAPTFLAAVIEGNPQALQWRNEEKRTLLMEAAFNGRSPLVDMLIKAGADVNADAHKITALMLAAARGHDDNVRLLLAAGADANARCDGGGTALTFAIMYQRKTTIPLLLDAGADINAGYTDAPNLMQATGSSPITKILLARGIDIDARDNEGKTALDRLALLIEDNKTRGGPYLDNAKFYGKIEKLIRDEATRRHKAPDAKPHRP